MPRYIDAEALYRRIKAETNPYGKPTIEYESGVKCLDVIDAAPTADVAPVVHGEWLFIANGVEAPECSVCGWAVISRDFENRSGLPPYHKYCGHCGAKMERGDT